MFRSKTTAKRSRTVCPANGVRSNVAIVGASIGGLPTGEWIRFCNTAPGAIEFIGAEGFTISTRNCWLDLLV